MSILAVDFGSIHTRAVLIDKVEGVYQLIARAQTRTTDGFPVSDITVGLDRALRELSEVTGRTFISPTGFIISPETDENTGVNIFTATASLGRPLRAVVVGLMPGISVLSAIRAAAGTYVEIVQTVHLADGRTDQERMNAILLSYPDVVILAGGVENGARQSVIELARIAKLAVSLLEEQRRPTVIYSGNSRALPQVTAIFDGTAPFLAAFNVRPSLTREEIISAQAQLAKAFDIYKEQRSQGFSSIAEMSATGVMPTAQSYNTVVNYLGKRDNTGVIAIDVGSTASVVATSIRKSVNTVIRTDLGLGHNAPTLLDTVGIAELRKWLPFNIPERELRNYAANKTLRPGTVPGTLRDTYIEHALLRAGTSQLLQVAYPEWEESATRDFGTIIGAGASLNGLGSPGYTAMLLLDIVQPTGMSHILGDPFGLVPALGAVAQIQPESVVQVLDGNNLEPIGTCFSLSGRPAMDKPALNIKITHADGSVFEDTLMGGHIWLYSLPIKELVEIQLRVRGRGVSIGGKKRLKRTVKGGTAGLIIDLRGRPINFGGTAAERAVRMPLWISEATGYGVQEIDEKWLMEVEPDIPDNPLRPSSRTGLFSRRRDVEEATKIPEPDFDQILTDEDNDSDDPLRELRDASLS